MLGDAIYISPSTYPVSGWVSQSVRQSVGDSFRSGDSYRISELCELVNVKFTMLRDLQVY